MPMKGSNANECTAPEYSFHCVFSMILNQASDKENSHAYCVTTTTGATPAET